MQTSPQIRPNEIELLIKDELFLLGSSQVVYYDPKGNSDISTHIATHLNDLKEWFHELGYELCYIPEISGSLSEREVRYLFPNWRGEPLNLPGNDLLKPLLKGNNRRLGAGFFRKDKNKPATYRFFPLAPLDKIPLDVQLVGYKSCLFGEFSQSPILHENEIRYPISFKKDDDSLYSLYETKLSEVDGNFSEEDISREVRMIVDRLHKEGVAEFVLKCMVPVESKLSRLVVTPDYDILLPDYGNLNIAMTPLPKTVFLLFLRHPEGILFKELVDYRDEMRHIYNKISKRTSPDVIDGSLDKLTNPTDNAINEKCSRIREAFVKQIAPSLSHSYCITGTKSGVKRITLPRNLVEWLCEL